MCQAFFLDIILKFFEFAVSRCFLQVLSKDLNCGCDKWRSRFKKAALERELTIAIQEADFFSQEGKSPDAVRALIRRWHLIAFGNRSALLRHFDFDSRLPRLASEKYVTLRDESRLRGAKSKRDRPAAAGRRVDREVAWLLLYCWNVTLTLLEQVWVPASHTLYV